MYTITPAQYRDHDVCYDQYVLADTEAGTTLTLTPCKGGSITGMTLNGEEFIWLRYPNFYTTERPRFGVPVLFPQCGLTDSGTNEFDGQAYPMSIHGFACLLPWEIAAHSTEDGASMTLSLTDSAVTRVFYPFRFCVKITYTLKGSTVTLSQRYINKGDKPMPFTFGFHPYFKATDVRNLEFQLNAETVTDPLAGHTEAFDGTVKFPYNDVQTNRAFRNVSSPVVVTDKGSGHRMTVKFCKHFHNVVLWSECPKGFICIEPWNGFGWPAGITGGKDHEVLPAGETYKTKCSFTIEKLE